MKPELLDELVANIKRAVLRFVWRVVKLELAVVTAGTFTRLSIALIATPGRGEALDRFHHP